MSFIKSGKLDIHSVTKQFILVRVSVDPELILGTPGVRQSYNLKCHQSSTRTMHTHTHINSFMLKDY